MMHSGSEPELHTIIFSTNATGVPDDTEPEMTNRNRDPGDLISLRTQTQCATLWKTWRPDARVRVVGNIAAAIQVAEAVAHEGKFQALVTGSLHLVGGFIRLLDRSSTTIR
ncbi:hypothetical protein MRB53_042124 [Persea americana]|nr:hypothetical protein MRB53_042124 [Persea americana]